MHPTRDTHHGRDRGMTLVEVMVAVFLLAIVGTIISGIVIGAMKLTRSSNSGVESQSELNDAVARITRDIAAADPLLYIPTTGWTDPKSGTPVGASPTTSEIWVQSVTGNTGGKCVRTRYWVDTASTKKTLKATTQTFTTSACPDPRQPATGGDVVTTTIIKDLKTTSDTGAEVPVFTYYTKQNQNITAPVNRADVQRIARVKVDVGANVRDRAKGVRLTTSVAPRSIDNPLITSVVGLPNCTQTALAGTTDGAAIPAPVLSWSNTDVATTFTLRRLPNTTVTPNIPAADFTVTNGPATFTDTAMRGRHGVTIQYEMEVSGPGGTVICGPANVQIVAAALPAPTPTVDVDPDTTSTPQAVPTPSVTLNWPAVPAADQYVVYRRAINPNGPTYEVLTGACATWCAITTTTSLTHADTPGYSQAFEYAIEGLDTDWTPAVRSPLSTGYKALTHTDSPTLTGTPLITGYNRIEWTGAYDNSTADGYTLWARPAGTPTWNNVGDYPTSTTTTDHNAGLSTRTEYALTTYNDGPRGSRYPDTTTRYYGNIRNPITILQYPSNPVTTAQGTETTADGTNPDGTNTIKWDAVATADTYRVAEFESRTSITDPSAALVVPQADTTGLTQTDTTGNPRGARTFYMAIACNATGCSPNNSVTTERAPAAAYQRPPAPDVTPTQPTLTSNDEISAYTLTGDLGEPTDKFCAEAEAACSYTPIRNNAAVTTAVRTGVPTNPTYTYNGAEATASADWGTTANSNIQACNKGGCATSTTTTFEHYPGPFAINYRVVGHEIDHLQYNEGGTSNHTRSSGDGTIAEVTLGWTDSAGVRASSVYNWQLARVIDDPPNFGAASGTVNTSQIPTRSVFPGAVYRYTITANAPNGLTRSLIGNYQQAPMMTPFIETVPYCKETITDGSLGSYRGWHAAYRVRLNSGAWRGDASGTPTIYSTYQTHTRVIDVAGRAPWTSTSTNGSTHGLFADVSADVEAGIRAADPGTLAEWKAMATYSNRYQTRIRNFLYTNGISSIITMANGSAVADDDYYIPSAAGGGGHIRARNVIEDSGATAAHQTANLDFGWFQSAVILDIEQSGGNGMDCANTQLSWGAQEANVSRWALRNITSAIAPNGTDWAQYSGGLIPK